MQKQSEMPKLDTVVAAKPPTAKLIVGPGEIALEDIIERSLVPLGCYEGELGVRVTEARRSRRPLR